MNNSWSLGKYQFLDNCKILKITFGTCNSITSILVDQIKLVTFKQKFVNDFGTGILSVNGIITIYYSNNKRI